MKKLNRIISLLLTVLMIMGSLATVLALGVFSASAEETPSTGTGTGTGTGTSSGTETGSETGTEVETEEIRDYINDIYLSPDEKLATMTLAVTKDGYELYVDYFSGEVAIKNIKTNEILFTNPYDIALSTGNEETKKEILSQIIVTFTDNTGIERVFTSFEEAANRGQIVVEAIKNGVRVEYTIGRESSKVLVPRLISYERFEEMILAPLYEKFGDEIYDPRSRNPEIFDIQKVLSYFMIYSKEKLKLSKSERRMMEGIYGGLYDNLINSDAQYARALKKFPIIETLPVFVFDPDASEAELAKAESVIIKYCPEYTFEELEYDHLLTEYKANDKNPPVFRMALEYTIQADGLSVRLPANGIRFNESLYTLTNLQVLPYMGAGSGAYSGYNFFPDGSGTLFDFQQLNTNKTYSVSGKVYGTDFAYHEITETYQKTIRYPVFGIVEDTTYFSYKKYDEDGNYTEAIIPGAIVEALEAFANGETPKAYAGKYDVLKKAWIKAVGEMYGLNIDLKNISTYKPLLNPANTTIEEISDKKGFVAVIEEGDALASLTTYHAGALNDYNTIKMQFVPRPQDSYNLSDSISVGTDTEWTVVSDRKYVGNYKIKYVLLSDAENVEEDTKVYDTSWFGMAVAYRDYLTNSGVIQKQTSVYNDIPLYIETFGAIETTEKIMSIPVTVMAPLTTFKNVEQIYDDLSKQGMKNINFKLTGYANGGMQYTIPGNLKFEKAVGGNEGFQALLDAANAINTADKNSHFGVFPDFDFAYSANHEMFDGYNAYYHNAQTIDGRYASKKVYSATQQKYVNYYEMVISPAYFAEFYEKLAGNYFGKYQNINGISLSTLGGALNSDFDEDEPYNREDSKEFTVEAFEYFKTNYSNAEIMTNDGNAYVWKYVDHILGVSLDSSRYNASSKAVPFIGVVLHGSKSFAGEPLNMEGDLNYAILKAIENGASPYFILSYQNTNVLKENEQLSKYYSIRYDIWDEDIIDVYSKLNDAIGDVQDKYITGHAFFEGYRIPDPDEFMTDILTQYWQTLDEHKNLVELLDKNLREEIKTARENSREAVAYAAQAVLDAIKQYSNQMGTAGSSIGFENFDGDIYYNNLIKAYEKYLSASKEETDKYDIIKDTIAEFNKSYEECVAAYEALEAKNVVDKSASDYKKLYTNLSGAYSDYASGDINKAQFESLRAMYCAEFALQNIINSYNKEGFDATLAQIEKYAVSKIDVKDYEKAIKQFVSGKSKNADAIYEWIDELGTDAATDLKTALDAYKDKDSSSNEKALNKAIANLAAQSVDKEALKACVKAVEDAKKAVDDAESDADKIAAYKVLAKAQAEATTFFMDTMLEDNDLDAAYTLYIEKINAYCRNEAVSSAYDIVVESGFNMDFDTCLTKYYEFEMASVMPIKWGEMVTAQAPKLNDGFAYTAYLMMSDSEISTSIKCVDGTNTTDEEKFKNYLEATNAVAEMEAEKESFLTEVGSYEKYIDACAKLDVMQKLGYDKAAEESKEFKDYTRAVTDKANKRKAAISAIKLIDATSLSRVTNIYETAKEHYELAIAAVFVLEAAEGVELKYEIGREGDITAITNYDEIAANPELFIVTQAIDNARKVNNYVVMDKYEEIIYGSPVTDANGVQQYHNGYKLYTITDKNGQKLYVTGTSEIGYTYYRDEGGILKLHSISEDYMTTNNKGAEIYRHNLDGVVYYYSISDTGYTYYTNVGTNSKPVFIERENVTYDLSDEPVAYIDGEGNDVGNIAGSIAVYTTVINGETAYVSCDENGIYTKYNYNRAITDCYESSVEVMNTIMNIIANDSFDPDFYADLQARIEIDKQTQPKEDEEEVEVVDENAKYLVENIVAVTYGNDDGSAYKTILLNYNNYTVRVSYEHDGVTYEYNIPAYDYVVIKH